MSITIKTWVDRKGWLRAFVGGKEIPNLVSVSARAVSSSVVRADRSIAEPKGGRYDVTLELANVRIQRVSKKPR